MRNLLDGIQSTLLMGAGPSSVAPSTYNALSRSTLGHMDPYFIEIMDGVKSGLRTLMGTENLLTLPMSGTGSIGMEAAFVNMVEAGDKVLILQNGVFGQRMVSVASRLGAAVTELSFEWGKPVDLNAVSDALSKNDYKIVAVVYAETSTGVRNPVAEIGKMLEGKDSFYIVDAVTALGGMPVEVDLWGIDICYSGSQKCLACPPGASPITFSAKAAAYIINREKPVPNWYLDMSLLMKYWDGNTRVYHHTPPINMFYGIYQAIYNVLEEGPDNVFARHRSVHEQLVQGVEAMGWEMLVDKEYRLPMLNAIVVPEGIDEADLRRRLLNEYSTEISSGLGALAGKIVRIGLMGYNAQPYNVEFVLSAMKTIVGK